MRLTVERRVRINDKETITRVERDTNPFEILTDISNTLRVISGETICPGALESMKPVSNTAIIDAVVRDIGHNGRIRQAMGSKYGLEMLSDVPKLKDPPVELQGTTYTVKEGNVLKIGKKFWTVDHINKFEDTANLKDNVGENCTVKLTDIVVVPEA